MRTRTVFSALTLALLTAGCGSHADQPTPSAAPTTPGLTAYQRAYAAICAETTPEAPPTDAPDPDPDPDPSWQRMAWRHGFCQGLRGVQLYRNLPDSPGKPAAEIAAMTGDVARSALVRTPPDCDSVKGTRAEPYCP